LLEMMPMPWLMRVLTASLWSLALLAGCTQDEGPTDPGDGSGDGNGGGDGGIGSVSGIVHRTGGFPVSGASVAAGGDVTTTNEDGYFVLTGVAEGDVVLSIADPGYLTTYRLVEVDDGRAVHLSDLLLVPVETAVINAAAGGQVSTADGVGTVTFQPGTIVTTTGGAYTGDVTVAMVALEAGSAGFYGAYPGIFEGVRAGGGRVPLVSYGFMSVTLHSAAGAPLALAAGATAGLRLTIGAERSDGAPSPIPMWAFDPADGRWHEDGLATLAADVYATDVSRLGTWNWVAPVDDLCSIVGTVLNDAQQPVAGARVIGRSVDLALLDEVVTDATGHFEVRALRGDFTDLWAVGGSLATDPIRIAVGEDCPVVVSEPLALTMPAYAVSVTWSEEPSDLDAHLLIPMTWDAAFDYYNIAYYSMGGLGDYPFAMLDTDDTSSYGPEIITGTRLFEGRYQYWVNNWSGDDTVELAASGATVQLAIDGALHLYEVSDVPLAGADAGGWWHVFDLVVLDGVATVQPVMAFEPAYSNVGVYAEENKARRK
jgi:hypothetical protein